MTGKTMMAVVKARPEVGYDWAEVPVPEPGAGQVLVRIERAAVCGTDILLYKWDALAQALVKELPFIPGHECSAVVVGAGPGVEGIAPGTRVCAETHIPCGRCHQCTHGLQHICANLLLFGHHVDGCFAQYAVVPAKAVYVLQSDLPAEAACLLEPFGVSLRGVQEAAPAGDSLLVNGCGPIGLYCAAVARHVGAGRIMAAEVSEVRMALARRAGADVVIDAASDDVRRIVLAETDGAGAGCVIEASGAPGAVAGCLKCLRKGGRLVVLGNPKAPVVIEDVMPDLMHKELTLRTLHGRRMYETWQEAERLVADGAVDLGAAVSHSFPMARVNEAMQTILAGQACKVLLEPPG